MQWYQRQLHASTRTNSEVIFKNKFSNPDIKKKKKIIFADTSVVSEDFVHISAASRAKTLIRVKQVETF